MPDFMTPSFPNPYPEVPVQITDFSYQKALLLMRLKESPRTPDQEDAHYIVAADYFVTWTDADEMVHEITVPRGMLTDLTSVPRPFRGLVGRVGPWLEAAIVHDFLTVAWRTGDGTFSYERRKFADDMMFMAMQKANVGFRRWLIYFALRAYGTAIFVLPWLRPKPVDPLSEQSLYLNLDNDMVVAQLPSGVDLGASQTRIV